MEYKGYYAKVEIDEQEKTLRGEVIGINDVVTFQADTVKRLEKEFRKSVDVYLAFCEERGEKPEKPYSGNFMVRAEPELHRELILRAQQSGLSLNEYVCSKLREHTGERDKLRSEAVWKAFSKAVWNVRAANYQPASLRYLDKRLSTDADIELKYYDPPSTSCLYVIGGIMET